MLQYKRFYLLTSVAISLVIPFMHFEWYSNSAAPTGKALALLQVINSNEVERVVAGRQVSTVSFQSIAVAAYAFVALGLLILLVAKVAWVYRLRRKSNVIQMEGFELVSTQSSKAPFSFMNKLFWKEDIAIDSEGGQYIMMHELVHIRQQHTLDKLFMQVVTALFWINPFYWLMLKELSHVHEFIADEGTIGEGDTESFAKMLLQSQYGSSYPGIINPFFYSSIKRRLIMLTKTNKTRYSLQRKLMVLPLLAATVLLFSFSKKNVHRAGRTVVMVLDAGHGGNDNGAVASNGVPEKDMTLKVTRKLAALAADYNIKIVETRKDDNYITLQNRAKMANDAKGDVFVSIHVNSKERPGYNVILGKKNAKHDESEKLAANVIAMLKSMKIAPNVEDKGLWVLNYSNMPAILIECGNIDNSKDMAMINDDAALEQYCRNILAGVVAYL